MYTVDDARASEVNGPFFGPQRHLLSSMSSALEMNGTGGSTNAGRKARGSAHPVPGSPHTHVLRQSLTAGKDDRREHVDDAAGLHLHFTPLLIPSTFRPFRSFPDMPPSDSLGNLRISAEPPPDLSSPHQSN